MTKTACLYAIVRFAPFAETGEFANVGIVMMDPEQRYFGFKLMGLRHSRVTRFFEQLDGHVFRATMKAVREELERVATLLRQHGFDKRYKKNDVEFAKRLFGEMIRPRETVITFSEARVVLVDAAGSSLEELYGHYVERDFVTPKYQGRVLERGVQKWLWSAGIAERFTRMDVGNEEYHAPFPFVEKRGGTVIKAIKPLNLAQPQASKILDHGGQWLFRVNALKKRGLLPCKVLFAVGPPPDGETPQRRAFEEIVGSLQETGVSVLPYSHKADILEFAADQSQP
jgi:hypothetical protein